MEYLIGLMVIVMVLINVPIGFALAITAVVIMAIKGIGLLSVPLNLFHGADNFPLIAIPRRQKQPAVGIQAFDTHAHFQNVSTFSSSRQPFLAPVVRLTF